MAIEGGQFLSIQGKYDKGLATRWLRSHNANSEGLIIALGDGPNDQTMLSEADIAVVIKSPKSYSLKVEGPLRVIHTDNTGPQGWTEGIIEALTQSGRVNTNNSLSSSRPPPAIAMYCLSPTW